MLDTYFPTAAAVLQAHGTSSATPHDRRRAHGRTSPGRARAARRRTALEFQREMTCCGAHPELAPLPGRRATRATPSSASRLPRGKRDTVPRATPSTSRRASKARPGRARWSSARRRARARDRRTSRSSASSRVKGKERPVRAFVLRGASAGRVRARSAPEARGARSRTRARRRRRRKVPAPIAGSLTAAPMTTAATRRAESVACSRPRGRGALRSPRPRRARSR